MLISEFRGPGFTEVQWQHINSLATSLDARQLMWASGFLAGAELLRSGEPAAAPAPAAALAPDAAPAPQAQRRLTVLYASETGNSTALATALVGQAAAQGLQAAAHDLADYKTRNLANEQDVLIITSTYGEGDPPQPAAGFFEFIEGRKAPKLPGLRYAVLALGDSTYEHFCEAGKRLDRRLEELGAARLQPRVDCDVDYDEPAQAWAERLLRALQPADGAAAPGPTPASAPAGAPAPAAAAPAAARYDKRHPYAAQVIDNYPLTGRGSSKETRHIELSLEGSGLAYEPGDALGVMPANDPALVQDILDELGLAADAPVSAQGDFLPLGRALGERVEIAAITPRFLEHWGKLAQAPRLQELAQAGQAQARADFARHHHIVDVLRQFPAKGLQAQDVLAALRPLQPRLYSIASSPTAAAGEVHLTVSIVRYGLHGLPRSGVASGHLADRAAPDAALPVYVQANPHFRLPANDVPIIMIGAGTGVAPYRAFLQEREAREAAGRSWLFFGERNFRSDFLYQTEWQGLLKDGVLTRMDVAFSRDRHTGGAKTYVQHRLLEQARDVYAWLEEGAHVYVCGDASRLAPDVHQALASVVSAQGGLNPEAAQDYLRRLQRENRYQRDVY
ncbi:assimilatory sulfite reductase (NADPH) flavoprotein subunit [Bordetella petrii]|nr:assimilatory sulfite reductase (NADPH) flavoprotein subunit [Bordetella petrii]